MDSRRTAQAPCHLWKEGRHRKPAHRTGGARGCYTDGRDAVQRATEVEGEAGRLQNPVLEQMKGKGPDR